MEGPVAFLKSLVVGRPKSSEHMEHQRLSKKIALAVFASDALSSSAYATEEILLVLLAAGTLASSYSIPIAILISLVLGIVAFSYRQTIHAYPQGGGAYIVAHENLGKYPGLIAASAVLIDYVLTVAVSIAAGVSAVVSASPGLHPYRSILAVGIIVLITLINLRGVKEAGAVFAVPTYAFIALIGTTIVWGMFRYFVLGVHVPAPEPHKATVPLTFFLLAKAFSNGCTALTGVEAITDGVPVFRKPEARNAARTLTVMATLLVTMFVGLTVLARLYNVVGPSEHPHRTVVSLVALQIYGKGAMFYAVQTATALILFLAANTAYADFPRLSAILARDRYAPRQMMNFGDRLAYSNGIIALAALASVLVVLYKAEVSRLIHLYVVGVFTSFSLSQLGMVQRWRRMQAEERRWRRYAIINGTGAVCTMVVLAIVVQAKFLAGAWMVVAAIPVLVAWFVTVNRHYQRVALVLRDPSRRPQRARHNHTVLTVGWPSEEERIGLSYAQALTPTDLRCVHFSEPNEPAGLVAEWGRVLGSAPSLELIPARTTVTAALRDYVEATRNRIHTDDYLTVVIPERVEPSRTSVLRNRRQFLMKASLLYTRGVVVTDIPYMEGAPPRWAASAAPRHIALVCIPATHNASLQGLEYARALSADDVRAVHVSTDKRESDKVVREWEAWSPGVPLEVLDSPYREVVPPLREYVRSLTAGGDTVVTLILPEFIVTKWWHHLLHNQTAVQIKAAFLTEPDVVVTSVTYRL